MSHPMDAIDGFLDTLGANLYSWVPSTPKAQSGGETPPLAFDSWQFLQQQDEAIRLGKNTRNLS